VRAKVQRASQITQDTFHRGEVRLLGIMHMEADLLDGVDDDRASEHHVLEGPSEAPEMIQISDWRPRSDGDLGLWVHRPRDRLAVHHAIALKDVESELALRVEESINLMLYGEPQTMAERAEILHGEFSLESRYGVLQERCARCGVHNFINIKQQVYCIGDVAEYEQ
jgi:hypothetical protein